MPQGRPLPAVLFSSPRKRLKRAIRIAVSRNRPEPVKKAFVKSYGCQMNVYDAQRMADVLATEGYAGTATIEEADLVILNTCHIREKAAEKVYSELGASARSRPRAAWGFGTKVVVAGCVAQAEGAEILRRAPSVDVVVGPQSYHRLPELLSKATTGRVVDTEFPVEDKFDHLPAPSAPAIRSRGVSAFLTIQEGCDKFCTFCVVPYTRGAEVSRPVARIIAEARRLAEAGVRELTLIGQNVNAFHGEDENGRSGPSDGCSNGWRLCRGSHACATRRATPGHGREPDRRPPRPAGRDAYLHLPVQSGSDRILEAMNRRHRGDEYRRIVERVRTARPDIALSSDFIVGFPGETDEDFEDTMRLVADIGFAGAFSFKYSPRPARRRPSSTARCRNPSRPSASPACRTSRRSGRRSTAEPWGAPSMFFWRSRPASGPGRRQVALSPAGAGRRRHEPHRRGLAGQDRAAGSNSLFGERVGRDALNAAA